MSETIFVRAQQISILLAKKMHNTINEACKHHFLSPESDVIGGYMQRQDAYSQSIHIGGATPRETEILALGLCNARLRSVTDARSRIDALNKTHQLWSLLVRDLAGSANKLPAEIKAQLVDLGFWAMSYSVTAMGRELSVQPLIDVNQNILEGLKMQQSADASSRSLQPSTPFATARV